MLNTRAFFTRLLAFLAVALLTGSNAFSAEQKIVTYVGGPKKINIAYPIKIDVADRSLLDLKKTDKGFYVIKPKKPGATRISVVDQKKRTYDYDVIIGAQEEILVSVGQVKVLTDEFISRIAVGNGKVVSANTVGRDQVLIIPEAVGNTSIHVWTRVGQERDISISVLPENAMQARREVEAALSEITNVRVKSLGDKILVEGDNLSLEDLRRVELIEKRYEKIVNMVSKVSYDTMIQFDVQVMEFSKNDLEQIGIDWQKTGLAGPAVGAVSDKNGGVFGRTLGGAGQVVPTPYQYSVGFGIASELTSKINLLVSQGKAMILAQPKLSCRNGGTAKFLSGGEVPLPIISRDGTTQVTFKDYGIALQVKPFATKSRLINSQITVDVSSIDPAVSVLGIPGFMSRKTETEFNLMENETLILSGLMNKESGAQSDKVPFLGDLPIIGRLFKSPLFRSKQIELVVFVTPRIMSTNINAKQDLVEHENKAAQFLQEQSAGKATGE